MPLSSCACSLLPRCNGRGPTRPSRHRPERRPVPATGAPRSRRLRAPAGQLHPAYLAAAAALGRAGAGHGRAHPPPLRGAGDQHATDAVQHRRRRAGRPAGRLRPDRAQPHHRRAGERRRRQGGAVPHVAGRRPAGRRRRSRGGAARAELLVARAGQERGADVLRRDLHRPGPGAAPARPRDHAGDARRRRAGRPRH